jgi:hypothetical protein
MSDSERRSNPTISSATGKNMPTDNTPKIKRPATKRPATKRGAPAPFVLTSEQKERVENARYATRFQRDVRPDFMKRTEENMKCMDLHRSRLYGSRPYGSPWRA